MKRLNTLISSALLLTVSSFAVAKETPPVGGEPKGFQLPKTTTFTLSNGLKTTFVDYGKTPKVTVRLVTYTGNVDDGDKPWLSDISYEMIKQGTKTQSALQIAEKAASMGGEVETSVSMGVSTLGMDVLSEFGGEAVALLADLAKNSTLPQKDFDRIKTDFQRQLKVQQSQPQSQAGEAFFKAIYGNHPYGVSFPTEASLNSLANNDVANFLHTNFVASRSHLYVSGVFNHAEVKAAIEKEFTGLAKGKTKNLGTILTNSGPKVEIIEREKAPQSTVRLGLAAIAPTHEDYLTFSMMNTMLGGAFSSRITSNIREDKGYTYSPRSAIAGNVNSGVWFQGADITAESTGAALTEVFKEINLLSNEAPGKEELEGTKNYLAGIFVLRNSSRTAIINQLSYLEMHGLTDDYLKTYVAKVHATKAEDISRVAKTYLKPEEMILVVVGDKEQVTPQLKDVKALVKHL